MRETLERWIVGEPAAPDALAPRLPAPGPPLELERVSELAEAIRTQLAAQDREREQIVSLLASLSEPLSALPRIASQQDRLGETLGQALVHAKQRDAAIDATLSRIVDGLTQQTEVAGLIQQQLDLNLQAANGVAEGTTRLTEAVTELASSSRQGTDLLSRLLEQTRCLAEDRAKAQGTVTRLLFTTLAVAIAASLLGVAAVVVAILPRG